MIEVGEYIRTNKDTEILKIIEVRKEKKCITDKYPNLILQLNRDFTKHSKNIIDLIEVGDYVNDYRVVDIMEDMKTGELHLEMTSDYTNPEIGDCTIYNKDIKTILTHELYEEECYKVGDIE